MKQPTTPLPSGTVVQIAADLSNPPTGVSLKGRGGKGGKIGRILECIPNRDQAIYKLALDNGIVGDFGYWEFEIYDTPSLDALIESGYFLTPNTPKGLKAREKKLAEFSVALKKDLGIFDHPKADILVSLAFTLSPSETKKSSSFSFFQILSTARLLKTLL